MLGPDSPITPSLQLEAFDPSERFQRPTVVLI
jgi:hypothetical protein